MSILMARQPPGSELRHSSLPDPPQLPSFKSFLSSAGQSDYRPHEHSNPQPATSKPVEQAHRQLPSIGPFDSLKSNRYQQYHTPLPPSPGFRPRISDYRPPPNANQVQLPSVNNHTYTYTPSNLPTGSTETRSNSGYADQRAPTLGQTQETSHRRTLIGEQIVEGKLCYVYSDHTHCPKSINGDVVNPKWGTTKAGKPRKRLGQACNTCREKKIRCDPQMPKCAQCQKFGRECRFEQSARGSQRSSRGSPPSEPSPQPYRRGSIQHDRNGSDTSTERTGPPRAARASISVEHLLSPASAHSPVPHESPAVKRRKYSNSPNMEMSDVMTPQKLQEPATFSMDIDPFQVDSMVTQSYIDLFLHHFNGKLYYIFPEHKFQAWASDGQPKSAQDRLLLYSMMALGTVFFHQGGQHQETFMAIAEQGLYPGNYVPTLQMFQAQLFITMLRFARAELREASDSCISLMKMATTLRLNQEPTEAEALCFGLDDDTTRECRRRTFWTTYILDSTLHYCIDPCGRVASIDCELRLPCDDEDFARGTIGNLPLVVFKGTNSQDVPLFRSSSGMAKILGGAAILRDIVAYLQCLKGFHREQVYQTQMHFQEDTLWRLEQWRGRVIGQPPTPGLSQVDVGRERHRREQEPCPLLLLYHFAKMLVFRHVRHEHMPKQQVQSNCNAARQEAFELLRLLHRLGERTAHEEGALITACPVTGFATFIAVDIVTAAGSMSSAMENTADHHTNTHHEEMEESFMDLVQTGHETLINLGQYWDTAKRQSKFVAARFNGFMRARHGLGNHKAAYFIRQSLYSPFGDEQDVIYGLRKADLFDILGMDESSVGEIQEGVQSP